MMTEAKYKKLLELNIFKEKGHGRLKLTGTSFEYFPYGNEIFDSKLGISKTGNFYWGKRVFRRWRPSTVDEALSELPKDIQNTILFNIELF